MQFGMPTLIELTDLAECAALCRELKLDFIELNMNLPQYQADRIDARACLDIAARYGIYYTIHLDENLNPCDFNPLVKKAYMETVLKTVALAGELNAPVLNMHLHHGVHFKMPSENVYLYNVYLDEYVQSLAAFRDACEKAIAGSGITICVENTDGHHHPFAQKALELLLQSDAFALTFDIGHNHVIGGGDEDIILQYESRLRHMHIHDAAGGRCHLALGDGEIDLERYFRLAKRLNARAVLETKTVEGIRRSAAYAQGYRE